MAIGSNQTLTAEMNRELTNWKHGTVYYAVTYYASRLILITASAVVAAKDNLHSGHVLSAVPWLAILVAVLTALDTWMKPQQKWRGFMESRDALQDLIFKQQDPNGTLTEGEIIDQFKAIRAGHHDKNVF
ncbi:hypothetical protein ACFXG4_25765 [Nocardia sp. NPDC059246]|uniref:hypothetical protein n=1 Tax=unclassified Nocardia TaxID=2637762 RepID=UPI0036CE6D21